jgi:hypothetical protein
MSKVLGARTGVKFIAEQQGAATRLIKRDYLTNPRELELFTLRFTLTICSLYSQKELTRAWRK